MSKPFKTEAEMAAKIVAWLENLKWEVYQEVKLEGRDNVADIVAVQEKRVWVIETKMQLGFSVLAQAFAWKDYAHYVSVGTPRIRHNCREQFFIKRTLDHFGIGHLRVDSWNNVEENCKPQINRCCGACCGAHLLLDALTPEHKTFSKAGEQWGGYWSPFKATCENVRKYVEGHPGATLKEMIDKVDTHYHSSATAKSALRAWIKKGIVKGVEARCEGRLIKLFSVKEK